MIIVVLMAFLLAVYASLDDAFKTGDPLAELLNDLTIAISFSALLPMWWVNWSSRQRLQNLFNEFAAIEDDFFYPYRHLLADCTTYDNYLLWKGLASLLQNLSFLNSASTVETPSILLIIFMCLLTILTNVVLLVATHFYLVVLHTYRLIWALNRRLEAIAADNIMPRLCQRRHLLSVEIDTMASIYARLISLCERYTRMHQLHLLLVIGSVTACNIEVLFYVRLLWSGKIPERTAFNVFAVFQIFVVNLLDFWLTITICELALVESRKTSAILRGFSAKPKLTLNVERSLECFAIICSSTKLRFHICGLFDINHLTGLKVLSTMILYLIYLVQYYHDNL
ncbi:gustatory receptor for bitter taste 22e-like [Ceratitis capitata]|uniref:gustatory receptor for bitter taste 22e-like n=1 Tax=Ceratitis capitata TaxID=7213 RepID=UPI000C6C66CD|nr:gustatory receptor for bitter taste 22e-like [Ceratitis capitata]